MKKKIIKRSLLGFPLGITMGYLITILISLGWANGYYSPCVPELISLMGNEINAVILQTVLCGILGTGFAASSVIWEIDNWSIVKQTGIYFSIISIIMLPIAYFAYWMEHSMVGFLIYFGIFALIFVVIWIIQFGIGRYNVKKMNEKLSKQKTHSDTESKKDHQQNIDDNDESAGIDVRSIGRFVFAAERIRNADRQTADRK